MLTLYGEIGPSSLINTCVESVVWISPMFNLMISLPGFPHLYSEFADSMPSIRKAVMKVFHAWLQQCRLILTQAEVSFIFNISLTHLSYNTIEELHQVFNLLVHPTSVSFSSALFCCKYLVLKSDILTLSALQHTEKVCIFMAQQSNSWEMVKTHSILQ